MKKLLKSEVCGIREQCTSALFTAEKSKHAAGKKKKKRKETQTWIRKCKSKQILYMFKPRLINTALGYI